MFLKATLLSCLLLLHVVSLYIFQYMYHIQGKIQEHISLCQCTKNKIIEHARAKTCVLDIFHSTHSSQIQTGNELFTLSSYHKGQSN